MEWKWPDNKIQVICSYSWTQQLKHFYVIEIAFSSTLYCTKLVGRGGTPSGTRRDPGLQRPPASQRRAQPAPATPPMNMCVFLTGLIGYNISCKMKNYLVYMHVCLYMCVYVCVCGVCVTISWTCSLPWPLHDFNLLAIFWWNNTVDGKLESVCRTFTCKSLSFSWKSTLLRVGLILNKKSQCPGGLY